MQRSRERDFSNTRLSYSRHLQPSVGRPSLSPSRRTTTRQQKQNRDGKLCVNCYNHQLSRDHQAKKSLEKQQPPQALTLSHFSKDNTRERDLYKNEAMKANEFNLKKMQENQRKRQEEKDRMKDQSVSQLQVDNMREVEERRQLQERRRNKLREDLEKQISLAKQRRQQQAEESKNSMPRPIIQKPSNQNQRHLIQDAYKQELLRQINQNKNKRHKQEQLQKGDKLDNQLLFVINAEKHRRSAQAQEMSFKQVTKAELLKKMELQKAKKAVYAQQREQQARNRLNQEKQRKQIAQASENQRRQKIERYICDLKKQMQQNASRRSEQFQKLGKPSDNCILAQRKPANVQPCSCCHKQTPNQLLSSYIREIKP